MNILIPIAADDSFFKKDEFGFPKPLIDILGKPMIEHTLACFLDLGPDVHFTFVVPDELCKTYGLDGILDVVTAQASCDVVRLKNSTQGAVCSALLALDKIDPDEALLISNSDHIFRATLRGILSSFESDVGLVTFQSSHPRWSYVLSDDEGEIIQTCEKHVISRHAIAGLYYFKQGASFVEAAKQTILNGVKTNNAFYISQVINELILQGKSISKVTIPSHSYFNLYSPQKVSEYEKVLRDERLSPKKSNERPVLVIPAAGEGSRFAQAGYETPKPFIDVNGQAMIKRVLFNLKYDHMETVVIARTHHLEKDTQHQKWLHNHGIHIVESDSLTEGTACTVLLAQDHINPDAPLIIANSDQLVDFDVDAFVRDCLERKLDGSILCFKDEARDPKWSFARTDENGLVTEVREKVAISDLATVGIYLFAKGSTFITACIDMISHNDRVNGEFYTCPVYNYAIAKGAKIGVFEVGAETMSGLGTPEDLALYLESHPL